jgi:hypothetical protein
MMTGVSGEYFSRGVIFSSLWAAIPSAGMNKKKKVQIK